MVAKVESARGWITTMAELEDAQSEAAQVAARTRRAIAKKIAKLVPKVKDDTEAQVVLHLAEAYANLAIEPPRTRAR
jgi:ribosome-associated translation inhibitor RaiA